MSFAPSMAAAQVTEPARNDMAARTAATADMTNPEIQCPQRHTMGPLGGTKGGEPRPPKISGRNHTYTTRNAMDNRMEPSNKRQDAARELLASNEESAKAGLRRMVSV